MGNTLRRDYEWEEDLPLEAEDLQASGIASGMGGQQGRSKSEHSQIRGPRNSSSVAADEAPRASIQAVKEPVAPANGRQAQPIHNRDPGSKASEADEGRAELA